MSSNKIKRALCTVFLVSLLLPLASCFSRSAGKNAEALLRKPDSSGSDFKGTLVTAEYGTVSRTASGEAYVVFPVSRTITSNFNNARLISVNVKRGDTVKEGDVIAEFEIEYSKSDLNSMRSELSIAEKQYEVMKSSYLSGVTASENRLAALQDQYQTSPSEALEFEIAKAAISLKKSRSAYDFFVYEQERILNSQRASIAKIENNIQYNKIYAPFDGVIGSVEYLPIGTILAPGTQICTVYAPDIMWIATNSDVSNAMRYNSEVEIKVSVIDAVYGGRIISAPDIYGMPTGRVLVAPEKPINIDPSDRFRRLSVIAQRYELNNVLVLPSQAVKNEDGKRYVYLYEDGIIKKRYVTVGLASITTVQILDGLDAGQIVVVD